ncbi:hypothetical protein EOL96_07995 [Candidatus Saccharibacteria bacterium]|nr:hypothetical protein [Candidatus Saccharibacteria bacterium]
MIRHILSSVLLMFSLSGVVAVAQPAVASAACDTNTFLTFPAWYRNLVQDDCELKPIGDGGVSLKDFITIVAINIAEIILQLVAYTAVVMLIVGGFKYITSEGDQNSMANAKKTITNSIIGLIISIFSVAIVNIVAGAL